jgi:hypothetical protein
MKNIDKIYQIGNFIAAQASDNIPNIGPLLLYILQIIHGQFDNDA